MPLPFNRFSPNLVWSKFKSQQLIQWPWVCMTLRSRSSCCEGHTRFWPLCPRHRTDFHQTLNSTCIENRTSFSDLEVKVISKVKGHFSYWLLCLYRWTDCHQTLYKICLEYGHSINDLEVKVIPRSRVETGNTFEWLAILFSFSFFLCVCTCVCGTSQWARLHITETCAWMYAWQKRFV